MPAEPDLKQAQLFLDDHLLDETNFVSRVWHQPKKHPRPVLEPETAADSNCPTLYGTVLHWRGKFRMWYVPFDAGSGYPTFKQLRQPRGGVLYAESDDGVHWTKPNLGQFELGGNKNNNLVLQPDADERYVDDINVMEDPDDSDWPLKAVFWEAATHDFARNDWGFYLARSKDGVTWDRSPGLVYPHGIDRFTMPSRRVNGKWLMFARDPDLQQSMGRNGRSVWRYESDDLRAWSKGKLVLQRDPDDPPYLQYYSMSAFEYESLLLGGLERMHMVPDRLDIELIWSRDAGHTWRRAAKRPAFLEPSNDGRAWDDTWVNISTGAPIPAHGQLWFFFSGRSQAHTFARPTYGSIGLSQLRIDGFASLAATEFDGLVLTKPLTWPGGDLLINADQRRHITAHRGFGAGRVAVELRDENNQPIAGYTFADANPLPCNTSAAPHSRAVQTWGDKKSAAALAGRRVRLAFQMRDAHLYSFCAGSTQPR